MMDGDTSIDEAGPDPDAGGGSGGPAEPADPADRRLYRPAPAPGGPGPAAAKAKAVARMREILENDEGGDRAHTAAARTLVSMTTATTSAIQAAVAVHQATELAVRVAELESRVGGVQRLHRDHGEGGEADEQP